MQHPTILATLLNLTMSNEQCIYRTTLLCLPALHLLSNQYKNLASTQCVHFDTTCTTVAANRGSLVHPSCQTPLQRCTFSILFVLFSSSEMCPESDSEPSQDRISLQKVSTILGGSAGGCPLNGRFTVGLLVSSTSALTKR